MVSAGRKFRALIQAFLAFQVSEGRDVRQAERKSIQIFIPYVGNGDAPILQSQTTTVPVVGGLGSCKLQLARFGIESHAGSCAQSPASEPAISQCYAELLELARNLIAANDWTAFSFL